MNKKDDDSVGGNQTVKADQGSIAIGRDVINSAITILHERALTASEQARLNREEDIKTLADGILNYIRRLQEMAAQGDDWQWGPYKGLSRYGLRDSGRFFGRNHEIQSIITHIRRGPLTVLYGESGTGKTSIVNAGIFPNLIEAGDLPVSIRAYRSLPSQQIRAALLPQIEITSSLKRTSLRDFLHQICDLPELKPTLILFLDQFEEFFAEQEKTLQDQFIHELVACLDDETLKVHWVLILRKEYLGDLVRFQRMLNPFENAYLLERFDRQQAHQVISEPLSSYQVEFEENLIERLLDDLGGDEIAPPELQLVCLALYEQIQMHGTERDSVLKITSQHYTELGCVSGILSGHLERVLAQLPSHQKEVARFVLESLVTSQRSRTAKSFQQLEDEVRKLDSKGISLRQILDYLESKRLLAIVEGGDNPTYELVHDYLAAQIDLDPETKARKAAQELLNREITNWRLFGVLIDRHTLEIITAHRMHLQIDAESQTLIAKSAFDAGVGLADWLSLIPQKQAKAILLSGLERPDATLRVLAASHLTDYFDAEVESILAEMAIRDESDAVCCQVVRTLEIQSPAIACETLLNLLEHPNPARKTYAIRSLSAFMSLNVARKLFDVVLYEEDEAIWKAALEALATIEASPYRAGWGPILRAEFLRRGLILQKLRDLQVNLPFKFRLRMLPSRVAHYLWKELRTRPVFLVARFATVLALYLGLAWFMGWSPFLRWEPVEGAPQESLSALAVTDEYIYIGSFDYGFVRREPDASWTGWQRTGLPAISNEGLDDPEANIRAIDTIAVDPGNPERVFALVRKGGLFISEDAGDHWRAVVIEGVSDVSAFDISDLVVRGNVILVALNKVGLYGSNNSGQSWYQLSGQTGLPEGEYNAVDFHPDGTPIVGGTDGLYRGAGVFPWKWERVNGIPPVRYLETGLDGTYYLALGWPRATGAGCYHDESGLQKPFFSNNQIVTALLAHPWKDGVFYVGTTSNVYKVACTGEIQSLGSVPLTQGGKLAIMPVGEDFFLLQANDSGLFRHSP